MTIKLKKPKTNEWSLKVLGRPDLTKLKAKLLAQGGSRFQRNDLLIKELSPDLVKYLLSDGVFFSGDSKLRKMDQSNCHENCLHLARTKPGYGLWLGLALSSDLIWRIHSWCVFKSKIIETTEKRTLYYGVETSVSEEFKPFP